MVHAESQIAGLGLDAHLLRFIKQRVAAKVWWGEGHTAALSDACQPMAPRASPLPLCAQVALAVSDETTLTLSAEAGVLLPWGARAWSSRTSISDRFFLGGIGAGGALRGFTQKGVGPTDARRKVRRRGPCVPAVVGLRRGGCASQRALHAHPQAEARERDALGGDVFCSVLAALNFQLPHEGLRATGCHGQLFVNGGTIAALSGTGRGLQQCVHELVTSFRWSVVSAPGRHQGGGGEARHNHLTSRAQCRALGWFCPHRLGGWSSTCAACWPARKTIAQRWAFSLGLPRECKSRGAAITGEGALQGEGSCAGFCQLGQGAWIRMNG